MFIPTYNEPVEVIAPTIAAACALEPAHQTWVLDDGDRPWVAELCEELGARYVRRPEHTHAKAGNMNHALELMAREIDEGAEPIDVIAVLDCDHVPLPRFLTATLGWFDDPGVALVQAPQTYYNSGAFDDDGDTGEQGMFFHVLLPARNHDGAGPFWCGSTSLIRLTALQQVGGISTATIVEDMHTTLGLIRAGWKTAYHHQVLALGLAPETPEQYLLQRRRWGMGSMQVLVRERLWAAKRWLSWRNFYEYLSGTLWWLEGVGTVFAFLIPAAVLVSGAQVSTAPPAVFAVVFAVMFTIRLWGSRQLYREHLHWPTAFALRILRVPVGLSCLWWLITRRTLEFQVTPKSGADERMRGRAPRVLWALIWFMAAVLLYALLGLTGEVPWHSDPASTAASGSGCCWPVWCSSSGPGASRPRRTRPRGGTRTASPSRPPSRSATSRVSWSTSPPAGRPSACPRAPCRPPVRWRWPSPAPLRSRCRRCASSRRPAPPPTSSRSGSGTATGRRTGRCRSGCSTHRPGWSTGLPAGAPAVAAERIGTSRRTSTLHRQYG